MTGVHATVSRRDPSLWGVLLGVADMRMKQRVVMRSAASATRATATTLTLGALATIMLSAPQTEAAQRSSTTQRANAPLTLVVDLASQRVRGFRGTKAVWSSRISSGRRGHRTPTGVFSIIQKRSRHFSNLYNDAPMPHMQRLTWSGIAFHGGPIPGYTASHGCVRLPYGKARALFRMTSMRSSRVVVTYGAPRPTVISHAVLPNRLPAKLPESSPDKAAPTDRIATHENTRLMNSVLGVSTALAASNVRFVVDDAPLDEPARSRTEVVARLDAAVSRNGEAERQAKAEVAAARAARTRSARRLKALNTSLRRARRALARAERKFAISQRAKARLVDRIERLIRANLKISDGDDGAVLSIVRFEKLAEDERRYDERLSSLVAEHDILSGEIRELRAAVASLTPELAKERDNHRLARFVLAEAGRVAKSARAALKLSEHVRARHDLPVHVLISRTKSKIYVRQGYKDIYSAPVTFDEPEKPIGTHVLTAISEAADGETLGWSSITVPDAKYGRTVRVRKAKSGKSRKGRRTITKVFRASHALDRVTLSSEAHQKLRELVKVGSSIIVSDRRPSIETGKGTDFIVLTR